VLSQSVAPLSTPRPGFLRCRIGHNQHSVSARRAGYNAPQLDRPADVPGGQRGRSDCFVGVSRPIDERTFVAPFGPAYFGRERVADKETINERRPSRSTVWEIVKGEPTRQESPTNRADALTRARPPAAGLSGSDGNAPTLPLARQAATSRRLVRQHLPVRRVLPSARTSGLGGLSARPSNGSGSVFSSL
jgi:hypothetical protein